MTTKEYLKQTFKLDKEIESLRQAVETLEAQAAKTTTTLDPNKVGGGRFNLDGREQAIVKAVDYKNTIIDKTIELLALKQRIIDGIYLVDNQDHRTLLIIRYINLQTFEQIAVSMSYSYRNILYMHGAALQSFEKVCTPLHIEK